MFRFTAQTEGSNKLRLRESLQEYSASFGVPAHVDAETAPAIVLDAFKHRFPRKVDGGLPVNDH